MTERGIILPVPAKAVAAYIPFVITGKLVFISGQLPYENGAVAYKGRAGLEVGMEAAQKAARLCALNVLAQLHLATGGDLDAVERCVKLGGFIASAPDFYDQPQVMNGASELIEEVFGDMGRHARFAVGVSNLPKQATVEIDAIFSLR